MHTMIGIIMNHSQTRNLAAYDASEDGLVGLVEFQQRHRRRMKTLIWVDPRHRHVTRVIGCSLIASYTTD
jgi:hypothetical protein